MPLILQTGKIGRPAGPAVKFVVTEQDLEIRNILVVLKTAQRVGIAVGKYFSLHC